MGDSGPGAKGMEWVDRMSESDSLGEGRDMGDPHRDAEADMDAVEEGKWEVGDGQL